MKRIFSPAVLFLIVFSFLLQSCFFRPTPVEKSTSSTGKSAANGPITVKEISSDPTYGYSDKNPIKVGGAKDSEGPLNERRYLDLLAGPNGEKISYTRQGSCCGFETKNSVMGGLLDIYEVKWSGQDKPAKLYINMYDYESLKAPVGFTIK
jgi:hypothetical protein